MEKKYYWIKLRTDFFSQETIDFLLSQKNGCEYIVLYQMLCLQTANADGRLCQNIGEMIIPYNVEKIVRDTKYFDFDTVTIALELFKKLGLIYEGEDNILKISGFNEIVGSETKWAEKKRRQRIKCGGDGGDNVLLMSSSMSSNKKDNVRQEKEKEKEIDKDIDIDSYTSTSNYKNSNNTELYVSIVAYLNDKATTHFKPTTNKTISCINARLREGFTLEDFKTVIDKKCNEWIGTEYEKYIRPETLFGTKFEGYLNQQMKEPKKEPEKEKDYWDIENEKLNQQIIAMIEGANR